MKLALSLRAPNHQPEAQRITSTSDDDSTTSFPRPLDEPCATKTFLKVAPDLTWLFRCGPLKSTSCYKKISNYIDNIMIVAIIIGVSVALFCAISLFFVTTVVTKSAILATGVIAGGISMLCAAQTHRTYLLLKRDLINTPYKLRYQRIIDSAEQSRLNTKIRTNDLGPRTQDLERHDAFRVNSPTSSGSFKSYQDGEPIYFSV